MEESREDANRIDRALEVLRVELRLMRVQDIKLLKELMHIQETIKCLSRPLLRRRQWASLRQISAPEHEKSPHSPDSPRCLRPRLKRPQSDSNYMRILQRESLSSLSSSDDPLGSLEEFYLESESEYEDNCIVTPPISTDADLKISCSPNHVISEYEEEDPKDDNYYEEVLQRNILLWKSYKMSTTL